MLISRDCVTAEMLISLKKKTITELCPLKSVAWEKWGTHDALQVQWPGNEVAKVHRQLRSLKIWIAEFPNGSCKILLCVRLKTMEMQLAQLVMFESGEMLFSSVKSKNCVCMSTERDVFIRILNTRSWAILYDEKKKLTSAPWNSVIYPYLRTEILM